MNNASDIIKGDKVAVLHGEFQGLRGIIDDIYEENAKVILPHSTEILLIAHLQNFSSAARKAWQTRPHRAAGRPKDPMLSPKRMVSLRLDAEVWDGLGKAAEMGIIRSRESAVNQWLSEKLDELRAQNNRTEIENS